jgi:hypothetical protein
MCDRLLRRLPKRLPGPGTVPTSTVTGPLAQLSRWTSSFYPRRGWRVRFQGWEEDCISPVINRLQLHPRYFTPMQLSQAGLPHLNIRMAEEARESLHQLLPRSNAQLGPALPPR